MSFISIPLVVAKEATITVGVYQNPPLVFYDDPQRPEGLFIDLLKYIARKENLRLRYRACNWSECLGLLKKGRIDILPAIAYSKQRSRWALFTDEDVIVNWAVICRKKGSNINSIPDLKGKSVAILKDDVYTEPFVDLITSFELYPGIQFFESYEEIFKALSEGKVDAGVVNRLYEAININRFPSVEATPIVFSPVKIRFALSKKSKTSNALKERLDRNLLALKQDEQSIYYKSIDRWLGVPEKKVIPYWVYIVIGGLLGVLISFLIANLYLRRRIKLTTEELIERYSEIGQMRQYLEAIFQNSPDMIFVHDETGKIVDINHRVEETYGFSLEEFQNLPPEAMMGKGFTPKMALKRLRMALDGKPQDFEWVAKDRKGREFPVEVRLRPFELTLQDGTEKRYVLAIVRDITEKKQNEERIKKSEQWFKTIFYEEPECVKITKPDGTLLDMNPAGLKMIGLESSDSLKGKQCLLIVHQDHREEYQAFMNELLSGKNASLEYRIKGFDGSVKWVETHATPVKDEKGNVQAIIAVTRDITEKRHYQEELERKVKERTENLQSIINSLSQREVRMAELKEVIKKLRAQLLEAGLEPLYDDPLKETEGQ